MRRKWLLAAVAVAVVAAGALLWFSRSGIEGEVRRRVVEELTERLGGEVVLERVRVAGHDELVIEGFRWVPGEGQGRIQSLSVAAIELDVDAAALVAGDARIRGVAVRGAVVELGEVGATESEPVCRTTESEPTCRTTESEPVCRTTESESESETVAAAEAEEGRPTSELLRRAVSATTDVAPDALAGPLGKLSGVLVADASITVTGGEIRGAPGIGDVVGIEGSAWLTDEGVLHGEVRGKPSTGEAIDATFDLAADRPLLGSIGLEGVALDRLTTTLPLPEGSTWEGGLVDLSFATRADAGDGTLRWDLSADVRELSVSLAEFGNLPLLVELRQMVELKPEPDVARIEIVDWRWSFNGVSGTGSGRISELDAEPDLRLVLQLQDVPYASIAAGLPEQILPREWGIELGGTLDLTVRVGGPLQDRSAWDLGWKGDWSRLSLRSSQVGEEITSLAGEFSYTIPRKDREPLQRVMGPRDSHYLPLRMINPHLVAAVLVCEDATFYKHGGFDERELREALLENLREGGGGRGGSTITQQVAKNLFLTGERTWTRKLQEALLAWRLESSLDKDRILEIYLNLAEWGPGIYGIRDAAHHYFGTSTRQLNTWECIFLATLLPSPVRYHGYFHPGGQITDGWREHMDLALYRMHHQRYLGDDEHAAAQSRTLRFSPCGG